MQTSGYSGKSLSEKLGLKDDTKAVVLNPPDHYFDLIGKERFALKKVTHVKTAVDFIHAFYTQQSKLAKDFPDLVKNLKEKGMIWISWPKKSSKMLTDLDENVVREVGLTLGVVDVKVCAIDEIWSGLKFLRRLNTKP